MNTDAPALKPTDSAVVAVGESLGWTGIIERVNRRGKLLGFCGYPPGYRGPRVNLYVERLIPGYCPPSACVSYPSNPSPH